MPSPYERVDDGRTGRRRPKSIISPTTLPVATYGRANIRSVLPQEAASDLGLRDYIRTLRRRKFTIFVSVFVGGALALSLAYFQTPRYAAVAKVLLRSQTSSSMSSTDAVPTDPARAVDTEIEVIKTEPVQDLVRKKLGSAPPASVESIGQTDLIAIRAESTRPELAAAAANAYADSYIEFRRKQTIDNLLATTQQLETKIADLQKQIDENNSQLDRAPVCTDPKADAAACAVRSNIEQNVTQLRTSLSSQQAALRVRLDALQVDKALSNGGAQVVTPASTPSAPFVPTPRRNAMLGALLGLMIGVGLAFLLEHLNESVMGQEDFERALPGIPVVGLVPLVADWKSREDTQLVSIKEPTSPAAEAYRILRTSIQFLGLDRELHLVQITSAGAQEGKSTTLANLAVAFAGSGLRTVAVCCDLRRPRLHKFFNMSNEIGFTSVLCGDAPLAEALQPVPGQDRLFLLASGPIPPNPAEVLSSPRTTKLLKNIAAYADVVLIDSPPVLPVTDALVLSQQVDSTVLVSAAGVTTRKAVHRAAEMLKRVEAPVIGAVLNGVSQESGYGEYSYRYYTAPVVLTSNGNGDGINSQSKATRRFRRKAPVIGD